MFTKTSTTSIMAVLITLLGFILIFSISFIPTTLSAEALTQIISFVSAVMMLAGGYYFGSSKQRGITQQADNITNAPLQESSSTVTNEAEKVE